MRIETFLIALVAIVILPGCSKNPAENVPAADVQPATNAVVNSSTTSSDRTFAFEPTNSSVSFVGSKVTGSHNGGFRKFGGELKVTDGHLANTGNKVIIDMSSLWTDTDRLTGHLKSADFFDVAKYPTATFETTSIEQKTGDPTVTGNLTLHGVTKQISFPAQIEMTDSAVNVTAEFVLNRFDFDIKYAGKADDLIRKEVVLKLKVSAKPGKVAFPATG